MNRTISRIERPAPEPGFLGEGHTAAPVIRPEQFEHNDPFILLMDDRVDEAGASTIPVDLVEFSATSEESSLTTMPAIGGRLSRCLSSLPVDS